MLPSPLHKQLRRLVGFLQPVGPVSGVLWVPYRGRMVAYEARPASRRPWRWLRRADDSEFTFRPGWSAWWELPRRGLWFWVSGER